MTHLSWIYLLWKQMGWEGTAKGENVFIEGKGGLMRNNSHLEFSRIKILGSIFLASLQA